MEYSQVAPTRDIVGSNFPNGAIHFKWQMSGQQHWVPGRTFCRIRLSLAKQNQAQLGVEDNIAPTMGMCSTLFQSAEFRINGKKVSVVSDFMSQVDALETRLSKSRAWLEGIGSTVGLWGDDFKERQAVVAKNASNEIKSTSTLGRLELGYDAAANTVAIAVDTGVLTFDAAAGQVLPLNADTWAVGDEIEIDAGGVIGTVRYRVSAIINATTLQLNHLKGIAFPAAAVPFRRLRTSASISNSARNVQFLELCWVPPLSIFKVGHALPTGQYELVLNPQTASAFQRYAIESVGADKTPNTASAGAPSPGSNFLLEIVDMFLYVNTVDGPRVDDATYLLDLEQTRCQAETISTANFQQKNFDVSPSTFALTACYQDLRAGTDTRASATRFRSYDAATVAVSQEMKLNRFFVNYAGQNLPAPDADPQFVPRVIAVGAAAGVPVSGVDYTVQRYTESLIYSGSWFSSGGGESLDEWHSRGSYYYFSWPRDGTDRSTRVNVHQQFLAGTDIANMRLLLFDHSKQVARVQIQGGRVVDVQLEDA